MNRGRVLILPGLRPVYAAPAKKRWTRGIGVSTPCGAVWTREQLVFVPGMSEL